MRTRCRPCCSSRSSTPGRAGRPSRLVLDIDSADDEVRGRQEGGFYHGYYNHYCFLPLYITCGGRPLFALLRPGNADPAGGVTGPLGRIVERLRQRWPGLEILLRADSSYAREEILAWCEDNGVDYVTGLARNSRLVETIGWELGRRPSRSEAAGPPGPPVRRVPLCHPHKLVPQAPGRRQGGAPARQVQPPLRRYLAARHLLGPDRLRARLLPEGQHGERDQGAAAGSLLRPDLRPPASPPTSSGSSSPPSPRSSSTLCAVRCTAPAWPAPPPEHYASSSSRSAPASWSRCVGSRSPWTPHTRPPPPSHASTPDYQGNDSTPPSRHPFQPILRGPLRPRTRESSLRQRFSLLWPLKTRPQSPLAHARPRSSAETRPQTRPTGPHR